MDISWSAIKEAFYFTGSLAGVFAFLRPVLESKFSLDQKRISHVLSLINEQNLAALEFQVSKRQIQDRQFHPFSQLSYEIKTKQDSVRFSGPTAKQLTNELNGVISCYNSLRELVQVDMWLPEGLLSESGEEEIKWVFNKKAFIITAPYPENYSGHLYEVETCANNLLRAYQRFQIASELHLLEAPIAGLLLKMRYKTHGLQSEQSQRSRAMQSSTIA